MLARELSSVCSTKTKAFFHTRVGKILRLFSLWLLIYLPISFICFPYNEEPIYKLPLSIIANILIYGNIQYAWTLWFLYSLLLITCGLWITANSKVLRFFFTIFVILFYIANQFLNYIEISEYPQWLQLFCKYAPVRAIGGGGMYYVVF